MSILQEIHVVLSENAELSAILGFLSGMLLDSWLSIGRDKRKEFNDLTKDIYAALNSQIENKSIVRVPINHIFIEPYFSIFKQRSFRNKVSKYAGVPCTSGAYDPLTGTVTQTQEEEEIETEMLVQHAKALIPYFYPR
ncbi:MAG: hypothetical protein WAW41_08910 [Methylobacter sp.]